MTRDVSVSRGTKYFRYFAFDLTLLVYRWGQPRLILIIIMHILDDNISICQNPSIHTLIKYYKYHLEYKISLFGHIEIYCTIWRRIHWIGCSIINYFYIWTNIVKWRTTVCTMNRPMIRTVGLVKSDKKCLYRLWRCTFRLFGSDLPMCDVFAIFSIFWLYDFESIHHYICGWFGNFGSCGWPLFSTTES